MCTCRLEREWVGLKEGATTSREGDWGPGVAEREGIWEREGEAMAIRGKLVERALLLYWDTFRICYCPIISRHRPNTTTFPYSRTTRFRFQGTTNIPRELSTARPLASSQSPLTLGGTHRLA